jgi:abhydrolase domain-containing protein 17
LFFRSTADLPSLPSSPPSQTTSEIFKDAGVNLISFDYSGYGASGGAPSFRGAAADAAAALEWTRTAHGLSAADIVIYGQSLGTGPAVVLAARTPGIAGLVLHSGTTGALRRRDEAAAAASPSDPAAGLTLAWSPHPDEGIPVAGLLAKTSCPLLIVHGTDDKTNLHAESQALAAVGGAARTTFFSAVGHGHDDVETRCAGYGPAVRAFLGRAFDAAAAAVSEA